MSKLNIAILGCTGHVGKNLMYYFGREETFELFLFSRDKRRISNSIQHCEIRGSVSSRTYDEFSKLDYDVIINCIGISDPAKIESEGKLILKLRLFLHIELQKECLNMLKLLKKIIYLLL